MDILALVIAIVALVVAVLAYQRSGGLRDLRGEITSLGSGLDALRAKTADALTKLERAVRPGDKPDSGGPKQEG